MKVALKRSHGVLAMVYIGLSLGTLKHLEIVEEKPYPDLFFLSVNLDEFRDILKPEDMFFN
jgi:hypothetical protein